MSAMPRERFLTLIVSHVEALAFEVWEAEKAQRAWSAEQNEAVAQYVSRYVERVALLDIST